MKLQMRTITFRGLIFFRVFLALLVRTVLHIGTNSEIVHPFYEQIY